MSTFTSVADTARDHYAAVPAAMVPDAYPNLRRVRELRAPLLVVHGDRDDIVPLSHGQALFDAAPEPKQLHVIRGVGGSVTCQIGVCRQASESAADAVANVRRTRGVDHLDRL